MKEIAEKSEKRTQMKDGWCSIRDKQCKNKKRIKKTEIERTDTKQEWKRKKKNSVFPFGGILYFKNWTDEKNWK